MQTDTSFADEIAQAVLEMAADEPFASIRLSALAARIGRPLSEFQPLLGGGSLSALINDYLDRACASEPADEEGSLRERIFDIAMLRFEAMEDNRDGVIAWQESWLYDPLKRIAAAKRRVETAKWVLICAGEDAGPFLQARSVVLSGILFRAEQAWRKEDGPDFTRTMAQLDRDLRDVDSWVERVSSFSFLKSGKKEAADFSAAH